jgi:hypothetical protein
LVGTPLIGDGWIDSKKPLVFGPDEYYPFYFQLPAYLPSSVGEADGQHSYNIVVRIELRRKDEGALGFNLNPKSIRMPFMVKRMIDLNLNELALIPGELRDYRSFGILANYCSFMRGSIGFQLKIPQRGYIPGQALPFNMEVTNNSNEKISFIRAYVIR